LVVGPGDEHDSKRFREVMEGMRVNYGRGRPRSRPGEVAGDSAYDTRDVRAYLRRRGIKANIPVNIRNRRRPRHGRPYRLDLEAYKRMRSGVERFFAWLTNGFRRLAIRWERLASTFTGFIQLACIIIYLRVFR
jgi:transposase